MMNGKESIIELMNMTNGNIGSSIPGANAPIAVNNFTSPPAHAPMRQRIYENVNARTAPERDKAIGIKDEVRIER